MQVVGVKHYDFEIGCVKSKIYYFKCNIDVSVGDIVLCEVRHGMELSLGRVVETNTDYNKATRYILSKVDLKDYYEGLKKEKRLKEIKDKMDKRRKQLKDIQVYAILSYIDEEMAKLLKEYHEVDNNLQY